MAAFFITYSLSGARAAMKALWRAANFNPKLTSSIEFTATPHTVETIAMGTRPFLAKAAMCAVAAMLLGSVIAVPAAAQQATSAAQTEAIILRPLAFFKDEDLNFGSILPSLSTAGTVRLLPNNSRTATGGIVLVGNAHEPARFTGLGTPNQRVTISVQANSIFITGPGAPMRVRNFEIGSVPNTVILTTAPLTFRIGSSTGAFNFPLGAILEVGANQTPGDYVGTFTINLNYL